MKILGKCSALAFFAGVPALFISSIGFAQDADGDEAGIEEVVVTGTRIKNAAVTAASPVQVVGTDLIQDQGTINIQEALQTNPTFGIAGASRRTSNTNITSVGSATVNLRNLGASRTLVLVDGKRMVAGQPGTTQVDLSMVPTDFIDRVEVLTGGASAIYGSDAVAGVVNLIYKRDFEGLVLNAQTGITSEGDGEENQLSLTAGHNFAGDRGNFMISAGWSQQGHISSSDRKRTEEDYASLGHNTRDPSTIFEPTVSRSGVVPGGIVQTKDAAGDTINWVFAPDGTASVWGGTQDERFNRAEYRAIASPVDRMTFATRARFDVSDKVTTIFEANYGRVSSKTFFEPSPYVGNNDTIGIGVNLNLENWLLNPATGETQLVRNPFIPDAVFNAASDTDNDGLINSNSHNIRLTQFGPAGTRTAPVERETVRIMLGAEGDLNDNWSYDLHYSYGRTDLAGRMDGLFHGPNFKAALDVVSDVYDFDADGDTTEAICVDADARGRGCIAADVYGEGNMTDEMLAYVGGSLIQNSKQDMHVVSANVTGSVVDMPAGPLLLAAGLEYRSESSAHIFDPLSNTHQNGYTQQTNTVGELDVTEAYLEVNVPLFDSLSFRAAARASDYSTVGSVSAYDAGLEWSPTDDLRFRAIFAHAVRAPNIGELFAAPEAGISSINDPCEGVTDTDTGELAENCRAVPGIAANMADNGGVFTLSQSDVNGVGTLTANNPNIGEETGETKIFGAVWTPSFADGLVITIDYFDIELEDAINRVSTSTVLGKCYEQSLDEFCQFVTRRATEQAPFSSGAVSQVVRALVNSGGSWSEGIDLTASYAHDIGNGGLSYSLSYTNLLEQGIIPLTGDAANDSVGELGNAEHRWFATVGYDTDTFSARLMGKYVGESYLDDQYWMSRFGEDAGKSNFKLDSILYVDAQVKWLVGDNYELYVGAKNLFDEDPPLLYSGVRGGSSDYGTSPGVYDAIGRSWYAGVRASF